MSTSREQKTKRFFESIAKENVEVSKLGGCWYGYSSELGVLRLFAKYNVNGAVHNENARLGYSENLKTWYFSLESTFQSTIIDCRSTIVD